MSSHLRGRDDADDQLREDALKPWQYRSWIFITDPNFATKAQKVLDLYARQWDAETAGGQRLRALRR